jgi:hypothetical protein
MAAIISGNFRSLNAAAFVEEIQGDRSNIYVGLGKSSPWGGTTTANTSDEDAPTPTDTLDAINEARQQMIGMKFVTDNDISHVVPRYDWFPGAEFVAWDSTDPAIFDKAFYCLTSDFKVYKCIAAPVAGGVSDVPTHIDENITATNDGYRWKYMYTVLASESEKFLTNSYMPVKTLTESTLGTVAANATAATTFTIDNENPRITVGQVITGTTGTGSGAPTISTDTTVLSVSGKTITTSAAVTLKDGNVITFGAFLSTDPRFAQQSSQAASRALSTAGGIERLKLISGGSGYPNDGNGVTLSVTGDAPSGSECVTPGNVQSSYISNNSFVGDIIIGGSLATDQSDDVGADFSVAQATISHSGTGTGAEYIPIISPRGRPGFNATVAGGGHGCDPVFELGGFYVGINVQISGSADSQIANSQDFRQISLIRNPLVGGTIPTNPATAINTLKYISYDTTHTNTGSGNTNYAAKGISLALAVQANDYVIETTAGFKGYIVNVDTTNKRIYYFQNDLTGYVKPSATDDMVIKTGGQEQDAFAITAGTGNDDIAVNDPELNFNSGSGEMLFLENRDPIQRSTSQIEDVKLIIEF